MGHNPSGHCFIASKLIDSIPISVAADEDLHPAKKPALDPESLSNGLVGPRPELSVVCKLVFCVTLSGQLFSYAKAYLSISHH